jgi:hypothetical protein
MRRKSRHEFSFAAAARERILSIGMDWNVTCSFLAAGMPTSRRFDLDAILYGSPQMQASPSRQELHDRRRRPRIPARWKVYLSRESDAYRIETVTRDLSSEGFYCWIPEPILPGQTLSCMLMMPSLGSFGEQICLKGKIQVMRLENVKEGYGIGCQIQEYNIVTIQAGQIQELAAASHALSFRM